MGALIASEAQAITLAAEGLLGVIFTVATLTDEAVGLDEVGGHTFCLLLVFILVLYRVVVPLVFFLGSPWHLKLYHELYGSDFIIHGHILLP